MTSQRVFKTESSNLAFPAKVYHGADLSKAESILVNFRVRIEKSNTGYGACHIEGVEFQPATYEIQEFFLPFVLAVRNGMDSYLNQFFGRPVPQHTLKNRLWWWIRNWIENTRFGRRKHE